MRYVQKAYSLISNGVSRKDHIMKAQLDLATKDMLESMLAFIIPVANINIDVDDRSNNATAQKPNSVSSQFSGLLVDRISSQDQVMRQIRSQYGIRNRKINQKVLKLSIS